MMNILLISIVVVFVAGLADAQHIGANASNVSDKVNRKISENNLFECSNKQRTRLWWLRLLIC